MPQTLEDKKSVSLQVMACCRQAGYPGNLMHTLMRISTEDDHNLRSLKK